MSMDIKTALLNVAVISGTAATVIKIVLLEYEGVRRVLRRVLRVTQQGRLSVSGHKNGHRAETLPPCNSGQSPLKDTSRLGKVVSAEGIEPSTY